MLSIDDCTCRYGLHRDGQECPDHDIRNGVDNQGSSQKPFEIKSVDLGGDTAFS